MAKNIYLVGFMGTGKSVTAKALALALARQHIDLDDLIVCREGCSINEIFEKSGEAAFRKIEKEIVLDVSKKDNLIISCGGGVVLDKDNVDTLKKTGILICLTANPEVIYNRVKHQVHRPLLKVKEPLKKIKELLNTRSPFYRKADHTIDTTNLTTDQVVKNIIKIIKANE